MNGPSCRRIPGPALRQTRVKMSAAGLLTGVNWTKPNNARAKAACCDCQI